MISEVLLSGQHSHWPNFGNPLKVSEFIVINMQWGRRVETREKKVKRKGMRMNELEKWKVIKDQLTAGRQQRSQ